MAITHTGIDGTDWDFDQTTGVFTVGSVLAIRDPDGVTYGPAGEDTFTINGGSDVTLLSDRVDYDPYLGIGAGSGADGTVTIDGAGSSLTMTGTGEAIGGLVLQIGVSGGTGTLNVTGGASFVMNDPTADEDVDDDTFFGAEGGAIGNRLNSVGAINVSGGSSFELTGTAPGFAIGQRGGTGTISVTGIGSTFTITNLGDIAFGPDGDDPDTDPDVLYTLSADLRVGRGMDSGTGGTGLLEVTGGGTFTVGGLDGTHKHGADIQAGREGGEGTINVNSGGTLNIHAADSGASLGIGIRDIGSQGNGAGTSLGILNVDNGAINIENLDGDASLNIGIAGATGEATVSNGGTIYLSAATVNQEFASANLLVGSGNGNAGQGVGGNGTLTITGDGSNVHLAGATGNFVWIGSSWNQSNVAGDGTIEVKLGGSLTMAPGAGNSLNVGGQGGAKGLLSVSGGGTVDLGGGGSANVWATGAGGSAHVIVDGAGSAIDNIYDFYVGESGGAPAGATGKLTVKNGASAGGMDAVFYFGAGGTLAGRSGTLIGDVELNDGGRIDLRDNLTGTMTINGDSRITDSGNTLFLDVNAAGNDRLAILGELNNTGSLAVSLNAIGSYKFVKGQSKTIATFTDGDSGNGTYTVTVTGQQADFSYYVGKMGGNLKAVVVTALNNGNTAGATNAGILDFGAGAAGKFVYNALTQTGTVLGGKYGVDGGYAVKVDQILGTTAVDNFSVTGATARVLKFDGRGGNDIIKGGTGIDTIIGGLGNDQLTGNAGNDIFVFNIALNKTTNVDKIFDFNKTGNDTIHLENSIFKKLTKLGTLSKDMFVTGTKALDANDHIIYNKVTGALSYDADGSGAGLAVQFASLTTKPVVTNLDFFVI